MKQNNLIILIVGIILVGLLLISGISNLSFNSSNQDNSDDVEQSQPISEEKQVIENPIENKEHMNEKSSNTKEVSTSDNSNST